MGRTGVIMNQTALEAALDAAAPNGGLWIAGQNAYTESLQSDPGNDEKAYYAALDAAAPDKGSWIAGRDILVMMGALTLREETPTKRLDIVEPLKKLKNWKWNKKNTTEKEYWTERPVPTLAFRLLIFGFGVIVFMALITNLHTPIWASILLFLSIAAVTYVIGEFLIRGARKNTPITSTAS